jgi:hypothetical protein
VKTDDVRIEERVEVALGELIPRPLFDAWRRGVNDDVEPTEFVLRAFDERPRRARGADGPFTATARAPLPRSASTVACAVSRSLR